jgi:A/G-specific adenine glycosylase
MLQQTRIEAVIPYYARFLEALPDIAALANAGEDRLMKLWEGLGYYSRARNLQKAAKRVLENFGGELPRDAKTLRTLPGIGDYTAGAIASIAYGEPEPAVDGNVLRVMTRVLARPDDIMLPRTRAEIAALLKEQYPRGERTGLLTEGIMELGETVCLPNAAPKCDCCPLKEICRACLRGETDKYPVKSPKKERRIEQRTVLLLRCGDRYAVRKREGKGLLAGLWEFPNLDGALDEAEALEAARALGGETLGIEPCGEAKHVFTHVEWHMRGYRIALETELPGLLWKTPEEIKRDCPIPTALKYYQKKL